MNILILGSGAREHSIAWAVKQNPKCSRLLVAPGNAGIADIAEISKTNIENCDEVVALAKREKIDFVIIGPEAPLAAGVSGALKHNGFLVFGPSQAAANLEVSKSFMKEICTSANIPTAKYAKFNDLGSSKEYVEEQGAPIVIKADGLAAGKGVTVAMDLPTAYQALENIQDWTLNRFRENHSSGSTWAYPSSNSNYDAPRLTKHLNNSGGFLFTPNITTNSGNDVQGWRRLDYPTDNTNTNLKSGIRNGEGVIPARSSTPLTWNNTTKEYDGDFAGYTSYSLWTKDIFDWEKNMAGLSSGSVPRGSQAGYKGSVNRYVGFVPDWNICKDVYEKQDPTDEFESITLKWVRAISNSPPNLKECCLLYTSPSPRDGLLSRMPSSA